ncbi:MAG TPA: FecR family protein [Polyangiaceae bacterium]|nr:FecR family protein [Polyangiaceae bacterium]
MVALESFNRLGRFIAREQAALEDCRPDHERIKARLLARRSPRRRLTPPLFRLAASVAAIGLVVCWCLFWPRELEYAVGNAAPSAHAGTWIAATSSEALKVQFTDGTRISLWPEARARVTRLSPRGADLVLEQGRASLNVVHRAHAQWQVSTGPFVVQVTGTRFELEWRPDRDRFELVLYEGHVRVTGCALDEGQELNAGQKIEASCARKEFTISALSRTSAAANAVATATDKGAAPSADTSSVPAPPGTASTSGSNALSSASATVGDARPGSEVLEAWLVLARRGRFADAYQAASSAGFEGECRVRTASELSLLADTARFTGHIGRARQVYEAIRQRWPRSASATMAAFQIGRAEFDQRHDYREAETWLRLYLSEQPAGEFAAPALGRLMEAEVRLKRYESSRALAKTYLDRYPQGSHADAAHQVLDTPLAR